VVALLLVPATRAVATPITLYYEDNWGSSKKARTSNLPIINVDPGIIPDPILSLPRFNPALGTLLSADVHVEIVLDTSLITHCSHPLHCDTSADGGGSASVRLPGGIPFGVQDGLLNVNNDNEARRECSFTTLGTADCSRMWKVKRTLLRDWSFDGDDLTGFVGTGNLNFIGGLSVFGDHEGFPKAAEGSVAATEVTLGDASVEILLGFLELAYEGWLTSLEEGHESGLYSDVHINSQARMQANVTYTFDGPAAAVPGPGTLVLLGGGLAALGYRRRKHVR
jgi:hypothetical protein